MKRALALLWLVLAPLAGAPPEIFSQISAISARLSEITGLPVKKKVAAGTMSRAELKRYLDERIRKDSKPEKIRAEEITLRLLGFVPPDFNLRETTLELLSEQAAAFYDFKRKKLVLTESSAASLDNAVLVHELAHALADQHFNLERYVDPKGKNQELGDDAAAARMAVMEGQATWLMGEVMAREQDSSLEKDPELVSQLAIPDRAPGQFPVFDKSPLYIRESLLFPYTTGFLFQHAVYKRKGKDAFTWVFQHPPASTQHILHPETYFENLEPESVTAPAGPAPAKLLSEGTLGELDFQILLRDHVGESAAEDATAWRGGAYRVFELKDRRAVLTLAASWRDEAAAERFFRRYLEILDHKWTRCDVTLREAGRAEGTGDNGRFEVWRKGRFVYSREGLP